MRWRYGVSLLVFAGALGACALPAAEKIDRAPIDGGGGTTATTTSTGGGGSGGGPPVSCSAGTNGPVPCTGLELWLDATDVAEGAVTSWPDKSPAQHVLSQDTATARPIATKTPGLNGRPLVEFDGVDDALRIDAGFKALTTAITILAVVVPRDVSSDFQPVFYAAPDATDAKYVALFVRKDGWELSATHYGAGQAAVLQAGVAAKLQTRETWGEGTGLRTCEPESDSNSIPGPENTDVQTTNFIGGSINDPPFHGALAELLVYGSELPNADVAAVNGYLADKWGVCP